MESRAGISSPATNGGGAAAQVTEAADRDGGAAAREAPAAAAVEGVRVAQVDAAQLGGKRVEVVLKVASEGGGRGRWHGQLEQH